MSTAAPVQREPVWPASIAVFVAMGLYLVLPDSLIIHPRWLIPAIEAVIVVPLTITHPHRRHDEDRLVRWFALGLISLLSIANIVSTVLLVHRLLSGSAVLGRPLIYSAMAIWLTNVIGFGLWFWELDRGGPSVRGTEQARDPDFAYPQMLSPEISPKGWMPGFVDYLYVSFTNAAAFSPTDTMPLTQRAKAVMTLESLVSIITVVVVAGRAINILT